eukprot:CAMPEP_0181511962 /NCGR_PEP_ID=MMETSP1110-20121109/61714_1 /TAXON_ID=174948 /ORGANISM="Symbiodinium sp., Strain CCMP421" /LENGTH=80 /DNA_ID=CAMNT_0023641735 /DNA_START=72 /DNA_END=311 /DNA_ORIENTATION=+
MTTSVDVSSSLAEASAAASFPRGASLAGGVKGRASLSELSPSSLSAAASWAGFFEPSISGSSSPSTASGSCSRQIGQVLL